MSHGPSASGGALVAASHHSGPHEPYVPVFTGERRQELDRILATDYLADLSGSELKDAIGLAQKAGIPFETRMLRGQIAPSIAKAAHDENADHVVLGSKGRTALKDLLIGSVAHRVAMLSDVPVTLVK